MKKAVFFLLAVFCVCVLVMSLRVLLFHSMQVQVAPVAAPKVDATRAAERLAGALKFRTISNQDATVPEAEFAGLQAYLESQFPRVHATLAREVVAGHSLLFTWRGTNPSLSPVLLMGHLDVVPVEAKTESQWDAPPFAGAITNGYLYGRGSLDDKGSVLAILEAAESLLANGYQPVRTVYFAFGHNEEVLGSGAHAIATLLKDRGIRLLSVLDEGSVILNGMVPGLKPPVALIGTAEKGYMSVRLTVQMEGGHSSMPPRHTAVGILSKAIVELEKRRVPARLQEPVDQMFKFIGPELSWPGRFAFANLWFFGPVVRQVMAGEPGTNAMIRTTTAPTMFEGSTKENVLPSIASAVINFRILPGDTCEEILAHVRNTVRDERVRVEAMNRSEASPISPVTSDSFQLLQRTIAQIYPGTVSAPSLVIGATDSRYYTGLSENVYRFTPFHVGELDLERVHGINERIQVSDYAAGIGFYIQYLQNASRN